MKLTEQLVTLESADLIRRAQAQPELEYLFRHVLVQDATYHSLLKQNRRTLHRAIGETLERLHADRLDEFAPLLAHHFYEADEHARALNYFAQAGDVAARKYATAESALHYGHALDIVRHELAAHTRDAHASRVLIEHVCTARGRMLELSARYDEALAVYHELEMLARAHGERALELTALMAQATLRATPMPTYDPPQAHMLLERALSLSHELGDRAVEARILWNLMLLDIFSGGDMQQVLMRGERAASIARELGMRELLAYILHDIFFPYLYTGQIARTEAVLAEACDLWRALGNLPMLAETLIFTCHTYLFTGRYAEALPFSDEAWRVGVESRHVYSQSYSRMFVGRIFLDRGDSAYAIGLMREAIRQGEEVGFYGTLVFTRADLAWAYGWLGDVPRGLALARQAEQAGGAVPNFQLLPLAALVRLHVRAGDLAAAQAVIATMRRKYRNFDDLKQVTGALVSAWADVVLAEASCALALRAEAQVVVWLDDFIPQLRAGQLRHFMPEALWLHARALNTLGRISDAHAALTQARAEAEAIGSRRMLWQILATLSELAAQRGDDGETRALKHQAREHITYIADHCPPELRASFLHQPEVEQISKQ